MVAISFRCKSCQQLMKFPGEKAGKKAKCPKCGTVVVIPEANAPEQADEDVISLAEKEPSVAAKGSPAASAGAAASAAPAAPTRSIDDDLEEIKLVDDSPPPSTAEAPAKPVIDEFANEGPDEYGVFVDPELAERQRILKEEEEAKLKKKKERKKLPKVARKFKAIDQAEDWAKVRIGLLLIFFGVCIWMFVHALQGLYVILGAVELSEYAQMIAINLEPRAAEGMPPPGQMWPISLFSIYMEMIAGRNFATLAKTCVIIGAVLYLFQALAWMGGYSMCLTVPRRFGMFGQVMTMMGLGTLNGLLMLTLKLLPVIGAYSFIMVSLIAPEICMTEYNMERKVPIHILWSGAPFWENLATLIIKFLLYLEPTFVCIFMWSIGQAVKDADLASSAKGLSQMCLGTFFTLVCFHLLSLCGCSSILVIVLRVVYGLWFFFLLMFQLQLALLLLRCRQVLELKIHPPNEALD